MGYPVSVEEQGMIVTRSNIVSDQRRHRSSVTMGDHGHIVRPGTSDDSAPVRSNLRKIEFKGKCPMMRMNS